MVKLIQMVQYYQPLVKHYKLIQPQIVQTKPVYRSQVQTSHKIRLRVKLTQVKQFQVEKLAHNKLNLIP